MANTHPRFFQSRSGHIRIGYGRASTILTRQQIDELFIDVYSLEDFDYDDFLKAYSTPNKACSRLVEGVGNLPAEVVKVESVLPASSG